MGSTWRVTLELDAASRAPELAEKIQHRLDQLEQRFSTWRTDSELSKFNDAPAKSWQPVAPEILDLLVITLNLAQSSEGAYDPTIEPLVRLWGFGASGHRDNAPSAAEILKAQARVGWQKLRIERSKNRLWQPGGLRLDFSSIVAGYATDQVAEMLRAEQLDSYLIDITGEMRAHGKKPDGSDWRVGIERPDGDDRDMSVVDEVVLRDTALVTSGNYRNRYQMGALSVSHLIDPRTARPVTHNLLSVSVRHVSGTYSDALASLIMVLGPRAGLAYAKRHNISVLLLIQGKRGLITRRHAWAAN